MGAPAWVTQYPIAHRGLHNERRIENTLAAIEAAVSRGFAVEIDVRVTADGHPVVFHDATLDRLTDRSGRVTEMSLDEVSRARLDPGGEPIPTLGRVLDVVGGARPLFVEVKSTWQDRTRMLRAILGVLDGYGGPLALMSFDHALIYRVRKAAPRLVRGLVVGTFTREDYPQASATSRFLHRHLATALPAAPHFVAADIRILPATAPMLLRHAFNVRLLTWTVRTQSEREKAARLTDQIIFEEPRADADALRHVAQGLDELLSRH